MKKRIFLIITLAALCLLSACQFRTVDQMYRVPKRPDAYNNLQSAIDMAMVGLEYCAPRTGENQQTVQMTDLDGDGIREYLLFAKGGEDKPLRILIFAQQDNSFALLDTIACTGTAFDLVEYVQMDGEGGTEIVVGCLLSEQLTRSVNVYTFRDGYAQQLLATNYTKFLPCDLDDDKQTELMVLRPGTSDTDYGIAELYGVEKGSMERSNEVKLSGPAEKLKRIITGKLSGGKPAVFVASTVTESTIITDVYALIGGVFTNVSLSNESGTSVQTLRNYYVYADDLDEDGEVELPSLITMKPLDSSQYADRQYLIRWYAMGDDGGETDKVYTYHNYVGGWYLELDPEWIYRISVSQDGNEYAFYIWDVQQKNAQKIFSVFALSGQSREEDAVIDNRFVIYKSESVIYAARLEVASGALCITQNDLIEGFRLIQRDWKTGEM